MKHRFVRNKDTKPAEIRRKWVSGSDVFVQTDDATYRWNQPKETWEKIQKGEHDETRR